MHFVGIHLTPSEKEISPQTSYMSNVFSHPFSPSFSNLFGCSLKKKKTTQNFFIGMLHRAEIEGLCQDAE